jgi:hypothetical protein
MDSWFANDCQVKLDTYAEDASWRFAKELILVFTLYIDGMVVFNNLRYNGEGESGLHLMSLSTVRRLDPLLNTLPCNSYGIGNLLMEGRVCMCKVDSSKACIGNDFY